MKRILIALLVCGLVVSCSSRKNTGSESEESSTRSEAEVFPWDDRTAFVLYAGSTEDDEPDETFPSLVIEEYDSEKNFLEADGAPYLSALTQQDMIEQIELYASKATDSVDVAMVSMLREWVNNKIDEGYDAFLYELEPPQLTGKAYPLAKKAMQE